MRHHAVFFLLFFIFYKGEGQLGVLRGPICRLSPPFFCIYFSFRREAGQAGGLCEFACFFLFVFLEGKLDKLEGFVSFHGADFYRLPRNTGKVVLTKEPWTMVMLFFT